MPDFDWRTETTLRGTVSRVGQWVRGACASCPQTDVLLYDSWDDETLLCTDCSARRALATKHEERCDSEGCGASPAWRDPVTGKNDFYCVNCHARNGTVFQNRWADSARVGRKLGLRTSATCTAAGYGTDCKGEVKPRGGEHKGRLLCNKHAGKQSSGPEWHQ